MTYSFTEEEDFTMINRTDRDSFEDNGNTQGLSDKMSRSNPTSRRKKNTKLTSDKTPNQSRSALQQVGNLFRDSFRWKTKSRDLSPSWDSDSSGCYDGVNRDVEQDSCLMVLSPMRPQRKSLNRTSLPKGVNHSMKGLDWLASSEIV